MLLTRLAVVDWQVDHPPARCMNMLNPKMMLCIARESLLPASAYVVQPLEWSVGSVCVAYARASMPRVPRVPRRPPRHAWHRLARASLGASLAGPAAASLLAMAAPALAMGAAEEASGSSFDALSAKINVLVSVRFILSLCSHDGWQAAGRGKTHPIVLVSHIVDIFFISSYSQRCFVSLA